MTRQRKQVIQEYSFSTSWPVWLSTVPPRCYLPGDMPEGVHNDRSKVLCELWSLPLAVLDHVIGQIDEGELAGHLG